jgi:hypothetical protein
MVWVYNGTSWNSYNVSIGEDVDVSEISLGYYVLDLKISAQGKYIRHGLWSTVTEYGE